MVIAVGYKINLEELVLYDSFTNEKEEISISALGHDDEDKIENFFQELKTRINGTIDCLCVAMDNICKNDFRKKFIEISKNQSNIRDVRVISAKNSKLFDAIEILSFSPEINDSLWIFHCEEEIITFGLWKFNEEKQWKYDKGLFGTKKNTRLDILDLLEIMKLEIEEISEAPYICVNNQCGINHDDFKGVYSEFKKIEFEERYDWAGGALNYALHLLNENEYLKYKSEMYFDQTLEIKTKNKIYFELMGYEILPYSKTLNVNCSEEDLLTIYEHHVEKDEIALETGKASITLNIDVNGIYNIDILNLEETDEITDNFLIKNIGCDIVNGDFFIYNSFSNLKSPKVKLESLEDDDENRIDKFFRELKIKAYGTIDCLCVVMDHTYQNDFRKKFIRISKKRNNIKNVRIISPTESKLIGAIDNLSISPEINDLLWIFDFRENLTFCDSWEFNEEKQWKFREEALVTGKNSTIDDLKKMKSAFKESLNSPYISVFHDDFVNQDDFQSLFPNCKKIVFGESYDYAAWALSYSRCLLKENEYLKYKCDAVLNRNISIKTLNGTHFELTMHEILPFNRTLNAICNEDDVLTVWEEEIQTETLPLEAGKYSVTLDIDINGIHNAIFKNKRTEEVTDNLLIKTVGCNIATGILYLNNSYTNETEKLNLDELDYDDGSKLIEEFYEQIKFKIDGIIDYLCVVMDSNYKNYFREKFIEISKTHSNIKNVRIIGVREIQLYGAIEAMSSLPQTGDSLWIFNRMNDLIFLDFWKYNEQKKWKYVDEWHKDIDESITINDLQEVKNLLTESSTTSYICGFHILADEEDLFKNAFPDYKNIIFVKNYNSAKSALNYARCLSNEEKHLKFKSDITFDRDLEVGTLTDTYFEISNVQVLPFSDVSEIETETIKVYENGVQVGTIFFDMENASAKLEIDMNGIFTVDVTSNLN